MLSLHNENFLYFLFSDCIFILISFYFFINLTLSGLLNLNNLHFNKQIMLQNTKTNFYFFLLFFCLFLYKFYWTSQLTNLFINEKYFFFQPNICRYSNFISFNSVFCKLNIFKWTLHFSKRFFK